MEYFIPVRIDMPILYAVLLRLFGEYQLSNINATIHRFNIFFIRMRINMNNVNVNSSFWTALDELMDKCEVTIDRLKGSCHPNWPDLVYPLDYGYLAGSKSGDGNEIDVWLGSMPGRELVAIAITVDAFKSDSEIKLLIGCTEEEIALVSGFHNSGCQRALVIRRDIIK